MERHTGAVLEMLKCTLTRAALGIRTGLQNERFLAFRGSLAFKAATCPVEIAPTADKTHFQIELEYLANKSLWRDAWRNKISLRFCLVWCSGLPRVIYSAHSSWQRKKSTQYKTQYTMLMKGQIFLYYCVIKTGHTHFRSTLGWYLTLPFIPSSYSTHSSK